jgi:hypothetical protein
LLLVRFFTPAHIYAREHTYTMHRIPTHSAAIRQAA